jgi:hypothetical protein
MLTRLVVFVRSLALICTGHRAVALENLALRQQLAVFQRTIKRPSLRSRDRLFWMALAHAWQDWRTALLVVQPDPLYAGIDNGSDAGGRSARLVLVLAGLARMRRFGNWSSRWAR